MKEKFQFVNFILFLNFLLLLLSSNCVIASSSYFYHIHYFLLSSLLFLAFSHSTFIFYFVFFFFCFVFPFFILLHFSSFSFVRLFFLYYLFLCFVLLVLNLEVLPFVNNEVQNIPSADLCCAYTVWCPNTCSYPTKNNQYPGSQNFVSEIRKLYLCVYYI
jgi:hypothetical protein